MRLTALVTHPCVHHTTISFEKGAKEITGHIVPDQAQFGPEYFLAFMPPDF
jgi:hypothetical protein